MSTVTIEYETSQTHHFPAAELRKRLHIRLQSIADDSSILRPDRPEWEPLLDSQRVVGTVVAIEDLFTFRVSPDRVVKKGGYQDVEEAVDDMVGRIKVLWDKNQSRKANR